MDSQIISEVIRDVMLTVRDQQPITIYIRRGTSSSSSSGPTGDGLTTEDGDYITTEDGKYIIKE